ncbi:MAG TPA: hypothetical protein VFO25_00355 [Candidatus Eremiobacteraceae bacterium]|nr:hypothetical protein [Candidatus Eremiobacteraceae bacterium]
MRMRYLLFAIAVVVSLCGAAPRVSSVPPSADSDVALSDGRVLHVLELPLARLDGVVLDGATFDASGTRAVLLARFSNGSIDGDWRRASPTQAYEFDVGRRTLTELTADGLATAVRWSGSSGVIVVDGGRSTSFDVGSPAATSIRGSIRLDRVTEATTGALVSPADEFRLQVLKQDDGSYAVGQVGAVRLRTIAMSADHHRALVGSFVVWIDGSKGHGTSFARVGPDDVLPPSFTDDAYGKTLTPVLPLGHLTYQGAYRNGIAYFAFSYGLRRIVATTSDFVNYSYPTIPAQPDYTVGDGLGAGADGILYFADPENRVVQIWRNGRYVEFPLTFPDDVSDTNRLFSALSNLTSGDRVWPPVHPDQDALDAAILEWRIYPLGDVTGQGWVASYLGRVYASGADRRFHEIHEPAFPFAVLSRTDDGRIWGASVKSIFVRGGPVARSASIVWSSRDGIHWTSVGEVDGSPGAVAILGGRLWAALSAYEGDGPGVELSEFSGQTYGFVRRQPTGAIYAGEDLFFADLRGEWYLVCGGEPGTRSDDTSGALVALHLDPTALTSGGNTQRFLDERLPFSLGDKAGGPFTRPSMVSLANTLTIVGDDTPGVARCCRWMTPEALQRFQLEYAWMPYPIARIISSLNGDTAIVTRTLERGPLNVEGQRERWTRNAAGTWTLQAVLERWKI